MKSKHIIGNHEVINYVDHKLKAETLNTYRGLKNGGTAIPFQKASDGSKAESTRTQDIKTSDPFSAVTPCSVIARM